MTFDPNKHHAQSLNDDDACLFSMAVLSKRDFALLLIIIWGS